MLRFTAFFSDILIFHFALRRVLSPIGFFDTFLVSVQERAEAAVSSAIQSQMHQDLKLKNFYKRNEEINYSLRKSLNKGVRYRLFLPFSEMNSVLKQREVFSACTSIERTICTPFFRDSIYFNTSTIQILFGLQLTSAKGGLATDDGTRAQAGAEV